MTTWDKNRQLVNGLWGNAEWTKTQVELWHSELYHLDQWVLEKALKAVAIKYTSDVPKIKWVLAEYKSMKAESRDELSRAQSPEAKLLEETIKRQEIDEQNATIHARIRAAPRDVVNAAAINVARKTGIHIQPEADVTTWTNIALGFMDAELDGMDAESPL